MTQLLYVVRWIADRRSGTEPKRPVWSALVVLAAPFLLQMSWSLLLEVHRTPIKFPVGDISPARIARLAERCREDERPLQFAPFTLALRPRTDFDPTASGCADCWAREICGAKRLGADGAPTDACALERALIECAVILSAPDADEDE